jgi:hypothetical protein
MEERIVNDRSFVKVGGVVNVLSAVCYIGTSVFIGSRIIYAWLGLIGTVLLVPATWGIYQFVREHDNRVPLQMGAIAMWTGAVFLIGIYTLAYLSETARPFVEVAVSQGTAASQPIIDLYQGIMQTANLITIVVGSTLTYGVAPLFISIASLRATLVPKWLGWMGVIGGAYSLGWAFFGWTPLPLIALFPSVALIILWQLILGVLMLLKRATA